jgi:hypothetical protein
LDIQGDAVQDLVLAEALRHPRMLTATLKPIPVLGREFRTLIFIAQAVA